MRIYDLLFGEITMLGGKREGAGRPKGSPNKVTADIKALAQSFGAASIMRLAELGGLAVDEHGNRLPGAESQATQVAAVKELLDRGYGKATQPLSGDDLNEPLSVVIYKWADAPDTTAAAAPPTRRFAALPAPAMTQ